LTSASVKGSPALTNTRQTALVEELEQRVDERTAVEHDTVGHGQLTREARDPRILERGEQNAASTGLARLDKPFELAREPRGRFAQFSRSFKGLFVHEPSLERGEPVLYVDRRPLHPARPGVQVYRQHPDRVSSARQFEQCLEIEGAGAERFCDGSGHDRAPPIRSVRTDCVARGAAVAFVSHGASRGPRRVSMGAGMHLAAADGCCS
jgi:hypothetical protein